MAVQTIGRARKLLQVRRLPIIPNGPFCCKTGLHHTDVYQCPVLTHFDRHISTLREQQKREYCFSATDIDDKKYNSPLEKLEARATETLKNLNEAEKQELDELKAEYASWKATLRRVPDEMTDYNWLMVMRAGTKTARSLIYSVLLRKEKRKQKQMKKHKVDTDLNLALNDDGPDRSSCNGYFRIRRPKNAELGYSSVMFGNPLVFDFSLREQLYFEAGYITSLLQKCYTVNCVHPEPFHFYFTGIPQQGILAERLDISFFPRCKYFIDFYEKDFHELFPAKKLVYLSPYSSIDLNYSFDDIYIIGALADKHNPAPYSYARAKELGIRTARFPVIGRRRKPLAYDVDDVLKVLLEINYSHDWRKALRKLPSL